MTDAKKWVLTDVDQGIWVDTFELRPGDLGMSDEIPWSIRKYTLRGGLCDGVDLVEIDNGALSLKIVPTRGMGIWRGACEGLALGWQSPVKGPVHPRFVNLADRQGLGWLAGFDELIVRCGLDSSGAPDLDVVPDNMGNPSEVKLPLHGRIANSPASRVEVEVLPGALPTLAVTGVVDEAALFCPHFTLATRIETQVGTHSFTVQDEVINSRAIEAEMELLYHCNFGPPFLEEGAKLVLPVAQVAPRDARAVEGMDSFDTFLAPTPGYVEQCYFFEPLAKNDGTTLALLKNRTSDKGVILRFNKGELPWFTLWKNTAAEGDGYVTGLEPATDFPNSKVFERKQGRLLKLPPGNKHRAAITIEVCDSKEGVKRAAKEIEKIQQIRPMVRHSSPVPEYTP